MVYKNEAEFAKAVKAAGPGGLYLLYGSERYLIDSWTKRLIKSFGSDGSLFNMQKLDGRKLDCDHLFDLVETLPIMAQDKCVLVDDLDLKALPAAEQEKLWEILGDVPPSCTLILTAKPGVFDQKTAAAKKLVKLCGEGGHAVELGSRGKTDMVSFLRGAAKKQGCELSQNLAAYLLEICEPDMGSLHTEVAKLCAYAGGGDITKEQIDRVVTVRTEARVFDLSKAILAGNPQRALEILRDLFYLREQPVAIVSVLSMSYTDLYRARVGKEEGKTPGDIVAMFGYKGREFRVNNAWNSRLSARCLRLSLEALLQCDRALKSTGVSGRVLVEQTVIRLLALQGV